MYGYWMNKGWPTPDKLSVSYVQALEKAIVKSVPKGKDQIKVLKPKDIPAELVRLHTLRNKADIKAELTVMTSSGRPVAFKGVIRNGKLIERIINRRFIPQKNLEHPHCGVRIWWSGGSAGYIFFRYSVIKTLAITGQLTAKERREIMDRLKGNRGKTDAEKKPDADKADSEA